MNADETVPDIRFLGDLARLELKPGDILVLTVESHIPEESKAQIRRWFKDEVPDHKLVILDGGAKLEVVAEAEVPR